MEPAGDLRSHTSQDQTLANLVIPPRGPGMGSPDLGRHEEVRFREICSKNDPAREGFIQVYQEAFAGPPYFEQYTPAFVIEHVWNPHSEHSVVVAEQDDTVVGLGCAHPILAEGLSSSSQEFLLCRPGLPFDPSKTIYMSELAVSDSARGQGIGTQLVLERCKWGLRNGYTHYAMRTAAEGSNSLNLYKRLGAVEIPGTQEVEEVEGGGITTASKQRVYLWGGLADCIKALAQMRS